MAIIRYSFTASTIPICEHKRLPPGQPKPNNIASVREENSKVQSLPEVTNDNQQAIAGKAREPVKGGIGNTIIHAVKKAACLCEPEVVASEPKIPEKARPQAPSNPYKGIYEEDVIANLNYGMAKRFRELNKQLDKRAAKRARKAEAARKEKEQQELKQAEIKRKEELKAAKRARINKAKEEERERKARKKARKLAKKLRCKGGEPSVKKGSNSSSGIGDSDSDNDHQRAKPKNFDCKKTVDPSPVSSSPVNSIHQTPSCGSPQPLPPGSPHFERVRAALVQASNDEAIPTVEEPSNPPDDVAGMSYRGPPYRRQSPITLQQHSRSSSPTCMVSPTSPQASRTPHPPGLSRTDYLSSTSHPAYRRSNTTGILDNNSVEKPRFSRHGSRATDINANSLSNLHIKHTPFNKLQQQTRQQPLRAIHPEPPSKTLSHFQSTSQRLHEDDEEELSNNLGNFHLDDASGSLSSKLPNRRSSFTVGQRSQGSSSDLRCPPIVGASPKLTRHSAGAVDPEYKPNFARSLANQFPLGDIGSIKGIPTVSRSKLGVLLDEPASDGEREKLSSRHSSFSSAQHSVLGTGRTGNYSDRPEKAGMHGLSNMGNTCFMNSILQCLSQNKLLRDYFLSDEYLKDINYKSAGEGKLVKYFASVMKQLWDSKRKDCVTPTNLHAAFHRVARHFGIGKQQDAQEFLCYLLSELHDETNTAPKRRHSEPNIPDDISEDAKAELVWDRYCAHNNSIFSRLFVGQLKSTLECQTCKNRSVTFDIFWDLSVPVPERPRSFQRRASWERDLTDAKAMFDIKDCLNKFTEAEVLDGENMVTCDCCKRKRVFTKAFSIQRFPKYLVLHLKRFSGLRSKLTTHVDFPLQGLDMSGYMSANGAFNNLFNLYTIVNHISSLSYNAFYDIWAEFDAPPLKEVDILRGSQEEAKDQCQSFADRTKGHYNLLGVSQHSGSMLGGHYIAYAKHLDSNKWNCYDDSRVESITEASVPSSYAYVLFYKQVDQ